VPGWQLGRNVGPTPAVLRGMPAVLVRTSEPHGEPVSLIGWCLGRIFARALARENPDLANSASGRGNEIDAAGQSPAAPPSQARLCRY
jgi:hypothetical protein